MENATKALLIAGSVLIVIVLIAVGLRILSSTNGVTNQVEGLSTTMEVSIFNSQFTQYEGTRKGSEVRALLSKIEVNNAQNKHYIDVTGESDSSSITITGNYTVTITGYDENGYINEINIQ